MEVRFMPRMDRTGPFSTGPLTGRRWGLCPWGGFNRWNLGDDKKNLKEYRNSLREELEKVETALNE